MARKRSTSCREPAGSATPIAQCSCDYEEPSCVDMLNEIRDNLYEKAREIGGSNPDVYRALKITADIIRQAVKK